MWRRTFVRLLLLFAAPVILLLPTLWATYKNLDRLPWGLDSIFGCREDGWNGTGCDPEFKRQYWRNVDGKTLQGWWPDHLQVIWTELSFWQRWRYSYQWCAWRNVGWNLRLTNWFGTSIHFDDIKIKVLSVEGHEITAVWENKFSGKRYYFKRRKVFGTWWEYGWELHLPVFQLDSLHYFRLRGRGYTYDVWPFKDRSIPSVRPRRRLK